MLRRSVFLALTFLAATGGSKADDFGLVTSQSVHSVRVTLDRFGARVREAGWDVFTEIDHAAAARVVGLNLPARTVIFFGNPRAGTGAMQAHPTLAIDLPMRVLVWEDDRGRVLLTRSSGEDIATRIFARHGITIRPEDRAANEALLAAFAAAATQ